MTKLLALLDCDILTYRVGFAADKKTYVPHIGGVAYPELESAAQLKEFKASHLGEEIDIERKFTVAPIDHCLQMVRTSLAAIEAVVGGVHELYLTAGGRSNFRYELATVLPYKGNRADAARPTHYDAIREYLVKRHRAILVEGYEADDEISIRAYEESRRKESASQEGGIKQANQATVIVSIDKDLDMIASWHYNFVTGEKYRVTEAQALRNFYSQLLTGDAVDNVPGIRGVGPKTAEKLIGEETHPRVLWDTVRRAWHDKYPKGYESEGKVFDTDAVILEVARLLWLKRGRDEPLWEPPR